MISYNDEGYVRLITISCDMCGKEEDVYPESLTDSEDWDFVYDDDREMEYHYCKDCSKSNYE